MPMDPNILIRSLSMVSFLNPKRILPTNSLEAKSRTWFRINFSSSVKTDSRLKASFLSNLGLDFCLALALTSGADADDGRAEESGLKSGLTMIGEIFRSEFILFCSASDLKVASLVSASDLKVASLVSASDLKVASLVSASDLESLKSSVSLVPNA